MTDEPTTRTLTYRELADTFGISLRAAEARARRRVRQADWRSFKGNDGVARFVIPIVDLQTEQTPTAGATYPLTPGDTAGATQGGTRTHESLGGIAELQAALARLSEQTAAELREARDLADRRAGELAELRERVGRAEGEALALREQLNAERGRAELARDAAAAKVQEAEAARDAARTELADWTAGGPLGRAWRALIYRRGRLL